MIVKIMTYIYKLTALLVLVIISGCAHQPIAEPTTADELPYSLTNVAPPPVLEATSVKVSNSSSTIAEPSSNSLQSKLYPGTGRFINNQAARKPYKNGLRNGDVTLNFENAEISYVADVILGDLLNVNFVVDPAVKGNVSLQTTRGVSRDSLLFVLENLLQLNGAALMSEGSLYRIVPLDSALLRNLQPSLPTSQTKSNAGYRVHIVPLKYIAADEMGEILKPIVRKGGILRVDNKRNLLLLAGSSIELHGWLQTIEIFDVNWLKGQSVGLFVLESADANVVSKELKNIFGTDAKSKNREIVRVEPLGRLNAVMVISQQESYVNEARKWIERLDTVGSEPGVRLFVYEVKHRKADELASLVQQIFSAGGSISPSLDQTQDLPPESVSLAPDLKPVTLESKNGRSADSTGDILAPAVQPQFATDIPVPNSGGVSIVADEPNNSILILSSASDYRAIESALKRLDTRPLQVLIEASIVEVSLTDELRYGLEWFFKNNRVDGDKFGVGTLDLGGGLGQVVPGFSYSVIDGADAVRGVLNALAQESKLNVLSSPSLMVLDNRTATIRVGDQQPVRTASTVSPEASTVTERIEYKDTGVLLTVTPQVNAGGLVTMDISQEVTDVGNVDSATGQRSFLQRNIGSTVAIQDGKTIVLGGLITENTTVSESGIPILHKIPVLGKLFGQTSTNKLRRELVVLITPKVVEDSDKAIQITNEFKERLRNMYPVEESYNNRAVN